jgi:hypothetical protein
VKNIAKATVAHAVRTQLDGPELIPRQINSNISNHVAAWCRVAGLTVRAAFSTMFLSIACAIAGAATQSERSGPQVTVDPKTTQNPVYAPLPSYPEEARIHHWGGFALYEVHCQFNGTAPYVFTRISTGHQVLDEAGKAALRQWRWHPGRLRLLAIFMTFEPGKQSSSSSDDRAREKVNGPTATTKTDLVCAPYPGYPSRARQRHVTGKGFLSCGLMPMARSEACL